LGLFLTKQLREACSHSASARVPKGAPGFLVKVCYGFWGFPRQTVGAQVKGRSEVFFPGWVPFFFFALTPSNPSRNCSVLFFWFFFFLSRSFLERPRGRFFSSFLIWRSFSGVPPPFLFGRFPFLACFRCWGVLEAFDFSSWGDYSFPWGTSPFPKVLLPGSLIVPFLKGCLARLFFLVFCVISRVGRILISPPLYTFFLSFSPFFWGFVKLDKS